MKFFLKVFTFVFLSLFWVTGGLNAQQVGVFDRDTGEPISDVAVFTPDRSVTALTDFDGHFDLGRFPGGRRHDGDSGAHHELSRGGWSLSLIHISEPTRLC